MERLRFRTRFRLKRRDDFRRVLKLRCVVSDERMVIFAAWNNLKYSRIGIRASRKVGNAIERNRMRRLTREAFRLGQLQWPKGLDFVCMIRRDETPVLEDYQKSLQALITAAEKKIRRSCQKSSSVE